MPRRQKQYHYIYKTTCLVTGKFYVGMHSTDNLDDRYLGSGKILGYSRSKHGDENHEKEILEMLPSREALKLREKQIVNGELLADPLNINLKYGGDGGWDHISKETYSANGTKGANSTNKKYWTKEKRSDNMKNQFIAGNRIPVGWSEAAISKAKSLAAKEKRSKTFKEIKHQSGNTNSQFGSKWVCNESVVKKIQKSEIEIYLNLGFKLGRK